MAYTVIPDTDIDGESPITTALMTALRDNMTAIADGDVGAPIINGKFHSMVIHTASATVVMPIGATSVVVELWGGGGGGATGATNLGGEGGSCGARTLNAFTGVPPTFTITIGAGGGTGATGGASSCSLGATAVGGRGGVSYAGGAGGGIGGAGYGIGGSGGVAAGGGGGISAGGGGGRNTSSGGSGGAGIATVWFYT